MVKRHSIFFNFLLKSFVQKKGFSLLEVIVAIFILTVGVGGSFTLIYRTLSFGPIVEERLIAAYLAQEGIEIVRNIRDSNWLEQRGDTAVSWDEGLTNCQPPSCCEGDYDDNSLSSLVSCNYDDLHYLNIDSDGFYSYSLGPPSSPTNFKRKITIVPVGLDQINIVVDIEWKERGRTHSLKAAERLSKWR